MRIELITATYDGTEGHTRADAARLVLAGTDGAVGDHYAPASGVEGEADVEVQESKPIGAAHRRLFMRGNQANGLSFTVKPKYASLAAAAIGAIVLRGRAGATGQLVITPGPDAVPEEDDDGQEEETTPGEETTPSQEQTPEPDPVPPAPALVYPDEMDGSGNPVFTGDRAAVIRRVRTKQIGVTVEAKYDIEW